MNAFQVYATYEYDYDQYKVVPICVFFFFILYHFSVCIRFYLLHLCEKKKKKHAATAADVDTVLP